MKQITFEQAKEVFLKGKTIIVEGGLNITRRYNIKNTLSYNDNISWDDIIRGKWFIEE